eukprot:ANDGO_01257.mRNA.1 hypothetical protein
MSKSAACLPEPPADLVVDPLAPPKDPMEFLALVRQESRTLPATKSSERLQRECKRQLWTPRSSAGRERSARTGPARILESPNSASSSTAIATASLGDENGSKRGIVPRYPSHLQSLLRYHSTVSAKQNPNSWSFNAAAEAQIGPLFRDLQAMFSELQKRVVESRRKGVSSRHVRKDDDADETDDADDADDVEDAEDAEEVPEQTEDRDEPEAEQIEQKQAERAGEIVPPRGFSLDTERRIVKQLVRMIREDEDAATEVAAKRSRIALSHASAAETETGSPTTSSGGDGPPCTSAVSSASMTVLQRQDPEVARSRFMYIFKNVTKPVRSDIAGLLTTIGRNAWGQWTESTEHTWGALAYLVKYTLSPTL